VIVRISGEGQYDVPDGDGDELNRLDNAAVAAVDAGDEAAFRTTFDAMLRYVRERGTALRDEELHGSDVILPPADTTLDEAAHDFSGDGILPD
jgi:hypothetical protein